MILNYLNLTPDERADVITPTGAAEVKRITDFDHQAIKINPLTEKVKRKSTLAYYDEINLLDIFGALNY
jgi:hypothetical protein